MLSAMCGSPFYICSIILCAQLIQEFSYLQTKILENLGKIQRTKEQLIISSSNFYIYILYSFFFFFLLVYCRPLISCVYSMVPWILQAQPELVPGLLRLALNDALTYDKVASLLKIVFHSLSIYWNVACLNISAIQPCLVHPLIWLFKCSPKAQENRYGIQTHFEGIVCVSHFFSGVQDWWCKWLCAVHI